MITIAIANQKGGCGKTTTCAMLGAELALRGYETLIIDSDPQGHASQIFVDPGGINGSLADVLVQNGGATVSLLEVMHRTELEKLQLVPSQLNLAVFDRSQELNVGRLRRALKEVKDYFEVCLIDTPPNLGMLLSAALVAADYVLVPVQAEPLAVEGVKDLLGVVREAQELNEDLKVLGAVTTMLDKRTSVGLEIHASMREMFPYKTFDTAIRRQVRLCECPSVHQPIQLYAPKSTGSVDYGSFTTELLAELGLPAAERRAANG